MTSDTRPPLNCSEVTAISDDFGDGRFSDQWRVKYDSSSGTATESLGLFEAALTANVGGASALLSAIHRTAFTSGRVFVDVDRLSLADGAYAFLRFVDDSGAGFGIGAVGTDLARLQFDGGGAAPAVSSLRAYVPADHFRWSLQRTATGARVVAGTTAADLFDDEVSSHVIDDGYLELGIANQAALTQMVSVAYAQVAGMPGLPWCPAGVFSDDFSDGNFKAVWRSINSENCTLLEESGQLVVQHNSISDGKCSAKLERGSAIADSAVSIQVTRRPPYESDRVGLQLHGDGTDVAVYLAQTSLFYTVTVGWTYRGGGQINDVTDSWIKVEYTEAAFVLSSSSDGRGYTEFNTTETGTPPKPLSVELVCSNQSPRAQSEELKCRFDNFNLTP